MSHSFFSDLLPLNYYNALFSSVFSSLTPLIDILSSVVLSFGDIFLGTY
jgi:hypothetical protein